MKKILYIILFTTWAVCSFGQIDSLKCNPNPFPTTAYISFHTVTVDTVTINIYNQWGQILAQPYLDSALIPGSYSCAWLAGSYPDASYYVGLISKATGNHPLHIIKNSGVGITQFKNPVDLKVFPNPTHGTISIQTVQSFDVLRIYSVDNFLLKEIINPSATISVTDLPTGVYLLKGVNRNKLIFSYKIIYP